ncbi:HK97 gp10 family phage protein, partial [Cereibacter sphaeroides]|uniref:HK97 gp10 family phage protein n=1 Tax=Cereibacter sphaeroides TaxID=1063 RepID=UPI003990D604
MSVTVSVTGLREIEAQLAKLSKATGKAALRRALKTAAQPLADLAQSKAPVGDTHTLAPSITVGTRLSERQAKRHRRMFRDDRASVEMFVGAGPLPSAHN